MDGYDYLAGFLLLFVFFIYITWFGFSVKVENQKDQPEKISINPYDQVPLHRKLIDKKNDKVGNKFFSNFTFTIAWFSSSYSHLR